MNPENRRRSKIEHKELVPVDSFIAHNVLILTAGQFEKAAPGSLDRCIEVVLQAKKNPIVVLGPDGDDFLRDATLLEKADLVFDPNFNHQMFSSLKAGLHATAEAVLALVLQSTPPAPTDFAQLEKGLLNDEYRVFDSLKSLTQSDTTLWLITARGVQKLRELPADSDWTDPELVSTLLVSP